MVYRKTERTERLHAARRSRILRAARKLFAHWGYDATTMRDVADAAGTSIGNLYFYFKNKETLLLTLMAEARAPIWEWMDEAAAAVTPAPARLAILVLANASGLLSADRDLTQAALLQGAPPEVAEQVVEAYRVRLREYLRAGFPLLPESELELAVTAWGGAARTLLERGVRGELDATPLQLAEYAVRWNLRGLGIAEPEIEEALATARRLVTARFPRRLEEARLHR